MKERIFESLIYQTRHWKGSLLIGIIAVILGILSSVEPMLTLTVLSILFIAGFLVTGIFDIISALSGRKYLSEWGWLLAGGIISLIFACILLAMPAGSMVIFIYYVSFYIMLQSLLGIWGAYTLKKADSKKWRLLMLIAVLGLILSLILILEFDFAANFITVIFSLSLICFGLYRIFYAFRLKKLKNMLDK